MFMPLPLPASTIFILISNKNVLRNHIAYMTIFKTFLSLKQCSKETKDFYFRTFVEKTRIGVGNLVQVVFDQTKYFTIEPNLLNIFVKNQH